MSNNLNHTPNNQDVEIYQQIIRLIQMLQLRASQISTIDHEEPIMLTIRECVEKYDNVTDYTLRKLSKQGKIASIRAGASGKGKILINMHSLEAYLNGFRR